MSNKIKADMKTIKFVIAFVTLSVFTFAQSSGPMAMNKQAVMGPGNVKSAKSIPHHKARLHDGKQFAGSMKRVAMADGKITREERMVMKREKRKFRKLMHRHDKQIAR